MYSTGRWRPYISISVWWDRISSQTAQPVHPHFSCGSTATDLLSLGIMKEICCNSYCVSHINFTFETKCRQFILAVVIWRWHWVRWGMIKHSTSQPCGLKCMQSDPLRSFLERWRKAFLSALVLHKKKHMFLTVLAKQRKTVANLNLFSFSRREGRSEPAICYNTPLKWLRICPNAVGVDHRITVSMAVNQGISFYLGCPKSALVSLTTVLLW